MLLRLLSSTAVIQFGKLGETRISHVGSSSHALTNANTVSILTLFAATFFSRVWAKHQPHPEHTICNTTSREKVCKCYRLCRIPQEGLPHDY